MSTCINCIWEEFSIPLKRFIKKRAANEQDIDDIFQEVFIKIHNNIGSLKSDNKINAWIYRVTRNTITDYYRKKNYNNFETTEFSDDLVSNTDEELSANTEIAYCLKVMVESLPETYKQAILLTKFQTEKNAAKLLSSGD